MALDVGDRLCAEVDDPADLAKIPMLSREDLGKEAEPFSNKIETLQAGGTIDLIHHDYFTNGVSYLKVLFDVTDLTDEELFTLSVLKSVIGLVNTAHYTYGKLYNEINLKTGGITTPVSVAENSKNRDNLRVFFEAKARFFEENTQDAISLIREILLTSDFSDTDRLREILAESSASLLSSLQSAGHQTAAGRAMASLSRAGYISDALSGVRYLDGLTGLLADYDARKKQLSEDLKALLAKICDRSRLIVDFTGQEEGKKKICTYLPALIEELPANRSQRAVATPSVEPMDGGLCSSFARQEKGRKEALFNSSDVCYVCRAGNFFDAGLKNSGVLRVLKVLLGYDYLWVNVRVQGGAYGCMSNFLRNGICYMVSYRDPNLQKTIDVYEAAPGYLQGIELDEDGLTKYIIGAIASLDTPLTPQMKGMRSLSALLSARTLEEEQAERDAIIGCSGQDIRRMADYLQALLDGGVLCVTGKEETIRESADLFDEIRPMQIG